MSHNCPWSAKVQHQQAAPQPGLLHRRQAARSNNLSWQSLRNAQRGRGHTGKHLHSAKPVMCKQTMSY